MIGTLALACRPAHAAPITLENTTQVIGSDGKDYSAVGANFTTLSVAIAGSEIGGVSTLTLAYSTTFSGMDASGDVTTTFPDVFLRTPGAGYSAAPFTYAIALGDEGANGGRQAGFYVPGTVATSADLWGRRGGYIYGASYTQAGSGAQFAAPVVMTSGRLVSGTSVTSRLLDTGTEYGGEELYSLDITLAGLSPTIAASLSAGFDAFWGTGDCANGAFLATTTGSSTPLFQPVAEPPSLWLAALGLIIVVASGRRRHHAGTDCAQPGSRAAYLGERTITICRISMRGICSTLVAASRSARIRSSTFTPISWWAISRPRKRRVTLTLSPSSMKFFIERSFTW